MQQQLTLALKINITSKIKAIMRTFLKNRKNLASHDNFEMVKVPYGNFFMSISSAMEYIESGSALQ